MSILDRGNATVTVYPELTSFDADGNPFTKPSPLGTDHRVMIQPLPQSGTSARRAEQDNEGFETEQIYRMRFTREDPQIIGPRSLIRWNGEMWAIVGYPIIYDTSTRTHHIQYTIKRA